MNQSSADRDLGVVATAIRIAAATLATLLLAAVLTGVFTLLVLQQLLANHLRDTLLLAYAVIVVATAVLLHRATRERMPKLRRSLATLSISIGWPLNGVITATRLNNARAVGLEKRANIIPVITARDIIPVMISLVATMWP